MTHPDPEHVLAHLTFWRKEISQQLAEWIEHCEGAVAVDRDSKVVWISKPYLEALGLSRQQDALGRHILELTPHSQMPEVLETGRPILLDIWTVRDRSFVISRVPFKDEQGQVVGAVGFVLYESSQHIQPLLAKFSRLQAELGCTRSALLLARSNKYTLADMVGHSAVMQQLKRAARRAARQDSTVLLLGETGTGKELLAHAIHAASSRASGPFVSVNIAAVPDTLLEAEFFGVAPGAYTGADRKGRDGKFKLADGGTLFLDEIGDMPQSLQAKLLRALQEGEIEPLGSNKLVPFNVRVVAATSRDLGALVREGRFREDLFYRLHVLPVRVPPLRERRGDIPALVEVLGEDLALRNGTAPPELQPDAMALLAGQPWRGNIRELRNVLEQAAMRSDSQSIDAYQLERILREAGVEPAAPAPDAATDVQAQGDERYLRPLAVQVAELEQRAIAAALRAHGGNKQATARQLGISRATLYGRLENPE